MINNPNNCVKRIKRELDEFRKNPIPGIKIISNENDITKMTAFLDGPPNSAYEEGRFQLDITFPSTYPIEPPRVRASTPIFHPNIDDTSICIDILKSNWSPALKITQVILSISSLLLDPCPENGYGNDAQTIIEEQGYEAFGQAVREHIREHALKEELKVEEEEQKYDLDAPQLVHQKSTEIVQEATQQEIQ